MRLPVLPVEEKDEEVEEVKVEKRTYQSNRHSGLAAEVIEFLNSLSESAIITNHTVIQGVGKVSPLGTPARGSTNHVLTDLQASGLLERVQNGIYRKTSKWGSNNVPTNKRGLDRAAMLNESENERLRREEFEAFLAQQREELEESQAAEPPTKPVAIDVDDVMLFELVGTALDGSKLVGDGDGHVYKLVAI
jgi:hypothetical protein